MITPVPIRRALFWLLNHVPLGPLAPWVLGLAIGRWPRKVKETDE